MPNTKRGFGSAGLIIVILIIIAGGVYLWSQKKVEVPTPVINTADWKTYKNDKYGFEVKYPPNWVVVEDYEDDISLINIIKQKDNNDGEAFAPFRYPKYRGSARTATHISNFSIYPIGYPSEPPNWEMVSRRITLHESVKFTSDFVLEDGRPFITGISFTNPPINWTEHGFISIGLPFTFWEQKCVFDGNELSLDHCDMYEPELPVGVQKMYGIVDETDRPTLNQILSTFRFTK